ncbi:PREDICTED: tetraspanin-33-like, partial [Rhagoletis zephyria]|uniref:tetraspanin-33-like n=1 Tax=Rhagoletis zephyria TaxID=28612 RepID=UPI00081195D9
MAFMFPNSFLYHIKEGLSRDPIIKYRDDPNLQNIIDVIQTEFRCCGISDKGYKDWSKNIYFECNDSGLINIECGFNMQNISSVVEVNKDIYTRGCIEAITETLEPNMNMVSIG